MKTNEGGNEGAEHFRQCHAQVNPVHTHLWLRPQRIVQGRLLDEGGGRNGEGTGEDGV